MRPRSGLALVLGILACALAAGAMAQVDSDVDSQAGSNARIVRLSFVQGDVSIERPESGGLDTAFLNMPVVEGSRVVTGDDGFAEIEFESGGTVRLTPGSELRVRELGLRSGHQVSMLELSNGTAYFNVKKASDDDFRVLVNGQEVRVAKSARFRIRGGRDSAELAVTKGEVELSGSAQSVRIKQDETITLDAQDPGRYFLARNVTAGSYDAWDQERDDYRARYVATSNSYRGYSSNYSYGVSDLNYYGSYTDVAGYGYVWRPYGYGIGWDPYSDGAWVWYPGYGYTWVSGYSWGWMPYRYGRWIFIPGYGWVWRPGNSWHRWNTCTAVYHPPRNYHQPTPPIHTGGGSGGHHGGSGSGGGNGRVVVVGQGPFTGHGPGFKNDGDGNPHAHGGQRQTLVTTGGAGNTTPAPSALTPGLQPTGAVAEELRRVHGQDLGMPARVRQQSEPAATTTTTTTTTVATPAATGEAPVSGGAGLVKPVQPVVVPARPVRGSDENVVRTPNSGTAPATTTTTTTVTTPSRPASSYTPSRPAPSQPRTTSPPASSYRSNSGSSGNSGAAPASRSSSSGSTSAPAHNSSPSRSTPSKEPK